MVLCFTHTCLPQATNDCPPAPELQASPLQSTHLNEEPVPPSRPESPEGTPPPVPPYRGSSPELHSSLSTLPLVKVNSPESIACGPTCGGSSLYYGLPLLVWLHIKAFCPYTPDCFKIGLVSIVSPLSALWFKRSWYFLAD